MDTNTDFEFIGMSCDREGQQAITVKEGSRQLQLFCSLAYSKIEFFYYNIKKWEYPFHNEPLTGEHRSRLVDKITRHFTREGHDVIIDRRRFCLKCHEIVDGSDNPAWSGGRCGFCGRLMDQNGQEAASI